MTLAMIMWYCNPLGLQLEAITKMCILNWSLTQHTAHQTISVLKTCADQCEEELLSRSHLSFGLNISI